MKIDKAILLAAGLGTRLRPLTLTTPKPLLPLDGALLIDHQLNYLARAGIKEIAINLYHLGEKIKKHVGNGSRYNLSVVYSEEPEILGTGGGIKKAATLLNAGAFLVLNSDALQDTDIAGLIEVHENSGATATMVVKRLSNMDNYNPVDISEDGELNSFGKGDYFYTGLQILRQEAMEALPPPGKASCLVNDGYLNLLKNGKRICTFIHDGYFSDLGTPDRYKKTRRDIEAGLFTPCCFKTHKAI